MAMYETIKSFNKQFEYEPHIENAAALKSADKFLVVGMGGSHLAADLLRVWNPAIDMVVHEDYGLPAISDEGLRERLIILSSYSGNTEEVLSAFEEAGDKNLSRAVISIGGKLIDLAKKNTLPYIQMPDTGIQPRAALGFTTMALLKLMNQQQAAAEVSELSTTLKPSEFEDRGRELAKKLKGFVPVIYSSSRNLPIAYNWKIKFNETGKIPAFYNVLSELNHNEMTGFDAKDTTKNLSKNFYFLLLEDESDHPQIKKRMQVLEKLYRERSLRVEFVKLINNSNGFYKIFSSLILADWTAYHTAKSYGVEPEQVPMVEEFKKLIKHMTTLTIVHIKDCTCCENVIKIAKKLEKEMGFELKLQDWDWSKDLIEKHKIVSSPAIFIDNKFAHVGELTEKELKDLIKKYE